MAKYTGGTKVAGGYYWNPRRWSVEVIPEEGGALPGAAGASYVKVPFPLLFVIVPVLATANTAVAAVDRLKERGAKEIRLVCLVSAPEGVERLRGIHPDVGIWTAAIDEGLNEQAFIVPGLGDAGDRAYGTK